MNLKIHRLTEGAMYLAIAGAVMLVNRLLSSIFDVYVPIIVAVIIILYTTKYTIKDGLILGVGTFILTFLFDTLYTLIYNVVAIFTGLIYGHFARKGTDKRLLMGTAILPFVIGEFIITIIILPVLGIETLEEMYEIISDIGRLYNLAISDSLLRLIYALVIFFTGAIEGILIHLLAVLCLKKLKIKVISTLSLEAMKIRPIYAYILLILIGITFMLGRFELGDTLTYGIYCFGIVAAVILIAQGYIFALLYGSLIHKRNVSFLLALIVIFFMPASFYTLLIIGFLYATGPLERYLEKRRTNA